MREKNVREINLTKENICFANKISVEDNVTAPVYWTPVC